MFAGVPVYLSFFYPRDRVGFRQGIFLSGSALANAYGGALGYAVVQIRSRLEPWRILFLVEGLPTYVMVVVAWFLFPDDIETAGFLTGREREVARNMVQRGQVVDADRRAGLRVKEFLAAFTDWRSYLPGVMYFGCNVSFASLPLFVPTIIAEIGTFSRIQANGLSAPPYLLTFFLIIFFSFASDRAGVRGPFVCVFALVSAIGFFLLAVTSAAAPRYLGVYLAITIFISVAILLPWVSNTHSTESKRAGGYAIFATFGQCGPILGTNLFPDSEKPYYRKGSWISFGFCLLVAITGAAFSFLLHRENKKLDGMLYDGETIDRDAGPNPRGFRYII